MGRPVTTGPPLAMPPTTSTLPEVSRTATCPARACVMLPVVDQVLVAGSYTSALLNLAQPPIRRRPHRGVAARL